MTLKSQISNLKSQIFSKTSVLIIGILSVAAFLRLYRIDEYMTFLGDEGRDVLVVYDILYGKLTLLGPTASVGGFFLGPIYYYFMAPFLWLFDYSPVGPAVMVGLFGIATVFLVYKVGSEFFDKKAGFAAALLYAISPLVVGYSRSSWNPNLMPFFSLISLYMLDQAVKRNSAYLFILCGILLGIAMQLHYLAIFLGMIVAVYVLQKYIFLHGIVQVIKKYTLLLFGFLIGWSPFLAFEVRHGFPNIVSITRFIFQSGNTGGNSAFFTILGDVALRLFGRLVTKFPPPEQISLYDSIIPIDLLIFSFRLHVLYLYIVTLVLGLASLVLLVLQYQRARKERKSESIQKFGLLFLWFSLGIFLFGFYKKPIYDYYLGFLFPLPFLLTGNVLSFLWTQKRLLRIFGALCFLLLVLINLSGLPFRSTPNRQLAQVKQIAQFVLNKTDTKPFNFALITTGNSDHGYRYFFRLANRNPVIIQNENIDPNRTTVSDQLLVVCESNPCVPLGNPLWEIAGFGRAEIISEWNISVVKVYKLVHYKQF